MTEYIYNKRKNLRAKLADVLYTRVTNPELSVCYIAIVHCDDKCGGDWSMKKSYVGTTTDMHDEEQIIYIMHFGTSLSALKRQTGWFLLMLIILAV